MERKEYFRDPGSRSDLADAQGSGGAGRPAPTLFALVTLAYTLDFPSSIHPMTRGVPHLPNTPWAWPPAAAAPASKGSCRSLPALFVVVA